MPAPITITLFFAPALWPAADAAIIAAPVIRKMSRRCMHPPGYQCGYTRSRMRKSFNTFALALLVAIVILWIYKREGRPRIDPPSVLAQIQRLNQLATVKYTIQKVIGLTEQKK